MKKLPLLLLTILAIACSKDDKDGTQTPNPSDPYATTRAAIVGSWQGDEFGLLLGQNGVVDSSSSNIEDISWQSYSFTSAGDLYIDSAGYTWGSGRWDLVSNSEIAIMASDVFTIDSMVLTIDVLNANAFNMVRDSSLSFGGNTYQFNTYLNLNR